MAVAASSGHPLLDQAALDAAGPGASTRRPGPARRSPAPSTSPYSSAWRIDGRPRTPAISYRQNETFRGETDTIGTWRNTLLALLCALAPGTARGQDAPPAAVTLPTTEVIGTSPLLGSGIDRDKVPAATRSFSDRDLRREGTADLTGTLNRDGVGVSTSTTSRTTRSSPTCSFAASTPRRCSGTPQGLAVYQNGVRINEAFGDTVNWDLIPDVAIDRIESVGANPVFGLNALGGALAIEMKNGFTFQGGEGELSGGSFGRHGSSRRIRRADRRPRQPTLRQRASTRMAGATTRPRSYASSTRISAREASGSPPMSASPRANNT